MSHQQYAPEPGPEKPPERRRTSASKRAVRAKLLSELQEDLTLRLRSICAHMPEEEFERLVLDMARMRMRFWDLEQNEALQVSYDPEDDSG